MGGRYSRVLLRYLGVTGVSYSSAVCSMQIRNVITYMFCFDTFDMSSTALVTFRRYTFPPTDLWEQEELEFNVDGQPASYPYY